MRAQNTMRAQAPASGRGFYSTGTPITFSSFASAETNVFAPKGRNHSLDQVSIA
jgi:hypothetical protein